MRTKLSMSNVAYLMTNENPDYLVPIRAISTNHNEHLGPVWIAEQREVE